MTRSQKVALACGSVTALLLIGVGVGVLSFLVGADRAKKSALAPMRFDLSNRIEIPNHSALQFRRGPFSISMWLRTTTKRKYIVFMGKRINGMGDGWVVGANDENAFSFYSAGCASPASSPQSFRDGQWHHLVVTRNGQTMTFYYDNQNVGSGPDTCDHSEVHPLRLGMDADQGWHFEGELAEVHIYNRALSDPEIALEWNDGKGRKTGVPAGGLAAGYHFEDSSGGHVFDFSGNGHTGRLIRSAATAAENSQP